MKASNRKRLRAIRLPNPVPAGKGTFWPSALEDMTLTIRPAQSSSKPGGGLSKLIRIQREDGRVSMDFRSSWAPDGRQVTLRHGFDPWRTTLPRALAAGGGDMGSPEVRAFGIAQHLQNDRKEIEADGMQLLRSIAAAIGLGLRLPPWMALELHRRLLEVDRYHVATLDEAFDHDPPDERTRKAKERRRQLVEQVHDALREAIRDNLSRPFDIALFEDVGAQFGIGKTLCREMYDEAVQERGLQDLAEFKAMMLAAARTSGETAI